VTYTINAGYGSGVTAPGLGFLLNNEMDDFAAKPGSPNLFGLVQGEANAIQPGKRPLSCMTPTILLRRHPIWCWARRAARIITRCSKRSRTCRFSMSVQDAVDYPRFHHQWLPISYMFEPAFRRAGQLPPGPQAGKDQSMGEVAAILLNAAGSRAPRPRSEGKPPDTENP